MIVWIFHCATVHLRQDISLPSFIYLQFADNTANEIVYTTDDVHIANTPDFSFDPWRGEKLHTDMFPPCMIVQHEVCGTESRGVDCLMLYCGKHTFRVRVHGAGCPYRSIPFSPDFDQFITVETQLAHCSVIFDTTEPSESP